MVAVRLDRRVASRLDPSDVVQESMLEAATRFPKFLRDRPLPFYPWLRRIAADQLADAVRRHLHAGRRAISRELRLDLPDESALQLVNRLFVPHSGPSGRLHRRERRDCVQAALAALPDRDREVLVLRYLEDLSIADAAAVLGVGESAVKMRLVRALQKLRDLLDEDAS
jgi:RNA polymerase sigma-70 factor (ECF subfamily)